MVKVNPVAGMGDPALFLAWILTEIVELPSAGVPGPLIKKSSSPLVIAYVIVSLAAVFVVGSARVGVASKFASTNPTEN
jgi:hypothetical protein